MRMWLVKRIMFILRTCMCKQFNLIANQGLICLLSVLRGREINTFKYYSTWPVVQLIKYIKERRPPLIIMEITRPGGGR